MLEFNVWITTVLNIILWPIIHMLVSWWITQLSLQSIPINNVLFKPLFFENSSWYKRYTFIHQWKDSLPDAASWFEHGFAKAKLKSHEHSYLKRFYAETIRGELAHWLTMICAPIFYLWNPLWACIVMTVYALVSNLPCILIQRYNRIRIRKILN